MKGVEVSNNKFLFLVGNSKMISHVLAVQSICQATLKQSPDAPQKFKLGLECANAMLGFQEVTKEQFLGFIDVIGGYYSASKAYFEKYSDKGRDARSAFEDAEQLLLFAMALEGQVNGYWELKS